MSSSPAPPIRMMVGSQEDPGPGTSSVVRKVVYSSIPRRPYTAGNKKRKDRLKVRKAAEGKTSFVRSAPTSRSTTPNHHGGNKSYIQQQQYRGKQKKLQFHFSEDMMTKESHMAWGGKPSCDTPPEGIFQSREEDDGVHNSGWRTTPSDLSLSKKKKRDMARARQAQIKTRGDRDQGGGREAIDGLPPSNSCPARSPSGSHYRKLCTAASRRASSSSPSPSSPLFNATTNTSATSTFASSRSKSKQLHEPASPRSRYDAFTGSRAPFTNHSYIEEDSVIATTPRQEMIDDIASFERRLAHVAESSRFKLPSTWLELNVSKFKMGKQGLVEGKNGPIVDYMNPHCVIRVADATLTEVWKGYNDPAKPAAFFYRRGTVHDGVK